MNWKKLCIALCCFVSSTAFALGNKNNSTTIKIEYLANHAEFSPLLAEWTYQAWHNYDPTLTVEESLKSIKDKMNTDRIPLTLIALKNGKPIAMANLKKEVVVQDAPAGKVWVGSFYVEPSYKNQGVDDQLLAALCDKAKALGIKELWVWESDPSSLAVYKRNGWKFYKHLQYQNHPVSLLYLKL